MLRISCQTYPSLFCLVCIVLDGFILYLRYKGNKNFTVAWNITPAYFLHLALSLNIDYPLSDKTVKRFASLLYSFLPITRFHHLADLLLQLYNILICL